MVLLVVGFIMLLVVSCYDVTGSDGVWDHGGSEVFLPVLFSGCCW